MKMTLRKVRSRWNWKGNLAIFGLYVLGFAAGFPFIFTIQEYTLSERFLVELLQGFFFGAFMLAAGLILAQRTGLGAPYIENWLSKEARKTPFGEVFHLSVIVVIALCFILIVLRVIGSVLAMAVEGDVTALTSEATNFMSNYPASWKWLLVSFHAGVTEEIIFRLGLMNFFVWVGNNYIFNNKKSFQTRMIWIANLIAALAFGAFHLIGLLPVPEVLLVQVNIVIQNMLVGLVFGWFYWKFGLESAMLTHFLLDVFFYVVMTPILISANLVYILAWLMITSILLAFSFNKYSAYKTTSSS
jgi:membrane protease YdiL (CAAX protease family)